jgi:NitT/TauT family transport system ATP-binding protein
VTAALAFSNLSRSFETEHGPIEALRSVNAEIEAGQFTALVGPSGCGKSTLLHIAAGLDTQFSGWVVLPEARRRRAYVFQQPRLLPWLTAVRNVAFVLEAHGQAHSQALATARQCLQLMRLDGFERRFPGQLSGGMQQRVALARALAVEPDLLLMDEPFAALDELTARELRGELLRLYEASPRTVLFVTHNVTEAAFLADRVLVMSPRPGRIVADICVDLSRPREYDTAEVAATAREIFRHLQLGHLPGRS